MLNDQQNQRDQLISPRSSRRNIVRHIASNQDQSHYNPSHQDQSHYSPSYQDQSHHNVSHQDLTHRNQSYQNLSRNTGSHQDPSCHKVPQQNQSNHQVHVELNRQSRIAVTSPTGHIRRTSGAVTSPTGHIRRTSAVVTSPTGHIRRTSAAVTSPAGHIRRTSGSPSGQSSGRLLPYVPQRYVVPPGRTLTEGRHWARARGVSFKDDLIEDLDESGVDVLDVETDVEGLDVEGAATSREEEEEDDLLEDLPPPADLIDVIGPAPSSRHSEDIPEPAPRDPDLLLNMVTYREQPDYREPVSDKSVDEYNGPYYGQASAGSRARVPPEYGSLRRSGQMDDIDAQAASRFTYGTYRRHQMPRFQRSEQQPPYQQQRHRRASDQYDMSYFESQASAVDDFRGGTEYATQQAPIGRTDSEEKYQHFRHLSDNQTINTTPPYNSDYRDKDSINPNTPYTSGYRDKESLNPGPYPSDFRDKSSINPTPYTADYRDKNPLNPTSYSSDYQEKDLLNSGPYSADYNRDQNSINPMPYSANYQDKDSINPNATYTSDYRNKETLNSGMYSSDYRNKDLINPTSYPADYRDEDLLNPVSYNTDYRDKESPPSYMVQGQPLVSIDSNCSPYQQQLPEEDIYQNVGARRASREGYGQMSNGYIANQYASGPEIGDRTNDFANLDPLGQSADWGLNQDPYAVNDQDPRMMSEVSNGYLANYDQMSKDDPNVAAYNYQLQLQQQQEQQLLLEQQQQLQLQQEQFLQYQQYKVEPATYTGIAEDQPFLADAPQASSDGLDWSGGLMSGGHQGFTPAPPSCGLDNNIQMSSTWEDSSNMPQDSYNNYNFPIDRPDIDIYPPRDRLNLIYLTLVLHGIGALMPWNMIIAAKELKRGDWVYMLTQYFVSFKLGKEYIKSEEPYATYFLLYVGIAAQIPNVLFNWFNVFINVGDTLTTRIVWTLLIEVMVFVATIVLAMVDTSQWPGLFFYLTIGCVAVLNMANGVYQNTVYGVAAKLPFKYIGAVVLGSNLSGTIVAVINIMTVWVNPNPRTAAIYYFITTLFILLACFDTYFALPLNRFYRYHNQQHILMMQEKKKEQLNVRRPTVPYATIFKQCFPQCFNVFFTYFVSLSIFPGVYSDVKIAHDDFFISSKYYSPVTCFFTFNICSVIGNLFSSACTLPGPRWLFVPVMLRFLFLPFFVLCNYRPIGVERLWPTLIHWDHVYWGGGALFGMTGGYLASLSLMYCPRCVEPEYSTIAAMFGAASIVTGMISGIGFSYLMPLLISTPGLSFEFPDWWPPYVAR